MHNPPHPGAQRTWLWLCIAYTHNCTHPSSKRAEWRVVHAAVTTKSPIRPGSATNGSLPYQPPLLPLFEVGSRPPESGYAPGSDEPASTKNQNTKVRIAEIAVATSTKSSTVTSGRESSSPRTLLIHGSRTRTVETCPVNDW